MDKPSGFLHRNGLKIVFSTFFSLAFLSPSNSLHATNYTWDADTVTPNSQDGGGTWFGTNNWWSAGADSTPPWNNTTDIAVFGSGTNNGGGGAGTAGVVTLGTNVSVGGLYFQKTQTGTYTIAGTPGSTLNISGTVGVGFGPAGPQTGQSSAPAIISATISGTGFFLFEDGNGIGLTLSGTNTYTGTLKFSGTGGNQNTLTAVDGVGLSSAANFILGGSYGPTNNVQSAQTILITSGTFTRALGTGAGQIQIFGSTSGFSQGFPSGNGSPLVINFGGAGATIVWGAGGNFNPGTFVLASNAAAAGAAATVLVNGIDLNNANHTIANGNNGGAGVVLAGNIINSGGSGNLTLNFTNGNSDSTIYLTGTNTYTGSTILTGAGTRVILGGTVSNSGGQASGNGGTGSLATSAIVMGATSGTVAGPQFGVNISGSTTISAAISGISGTTAVTDSGNSFVLYSGTVNLTGINSYGGGTLIKQGVLQITGQNSLSANTAVTGSSSGTLLFTQASAFTDSGTIGGAVNVTQGGTNNLTFIGSTINYTGVTNIASGTLTLGNGSVDASTFASQSIIDNGMLVFNTKGNANYAGPISGTGSLVMSGTGSQKLSGNNSYSGSTVVSSGTLQLGSNTALGNTSNITVTNAALNLSTGTSTQTITLNGTSGGMTLTGTNILTFGIGSGVADQLVIGNGASMTISGTTTINLNLLIGGTGGTFVLISDTNGFNFLSGGTFALGSLPSLTTVAPGGFKVTGTTVELTISAVSTVYWLGGGTSSGTNPGSWADYTNFTSDSTGTSRLPSMFGASQGVVFSATGATQQTNTSLNGNLTISSLTVNDTNAVGINSGSVSSTLTLFSSGIVTGSNAGALTIGANLSFSGTSNVTVNNPAGVTISGTISGTNGLLANGPGVLNLTGANNYTHGTIIQNGTLAITSDAALGASGSGNGVTFSGTGNSTLAMSGTTTAITTASDRPIIFLGGTGVLDPGVAGNVMTLNGNLSGGASLNKVNTGQVILGGSLGFNGAANISSGTLTMLFPGTLNQTGTSSWHITGGATLELNVASGTQNIAPTPANTVTFNGNGTLLKTGTGALELHGGGGNPVNGNVNFNFTGGMIEVAQGLLENGGPTTTGSGIGNPTTGNGGPIWTNNLASLQIDAAGTFDIWDVNAPVVNVLLGSGTLNRLGFNAENSVNQFILGVANGSGTFSGVITNNYGALAIVKIGNGTQTFSGNNSYSGTTGITAGVLKITSNTGLGFGGRVFLGVGTGEADVSGSGTLDLNSGVDVNKAIVLLGGSLINSGTGTTSILDSGIASVVVSGSQTGTYTAPNIAVLTAGDGTNATFGAGVASSLATSAGNNKTYVQVLTAGSGYTVAPTLQVLDGTNATTLNATAQISSLTIGTGTAGGPSFIGGNGNLTVNAVVQGAGAFNTVGTGTLTFNSQNTFTGTANITSGVTVVNGGFAAGSTFNVGGPGSTGTPRLQGGIGALNGGVLTTPTYSFGTLSSSVYTPSATIGNIQGLVHVSGTAGGLPGTLAPGNSVGTMTVGTLTMDPGSIANFEFSGTSNDFISVTGALTLNGVGINLFQEGTTNQFNTTGTYALFSYGSTATISGFNVLNKNAGNTYAFTNDTTDHLIVLTIGTLVLDSSTLAITPSTVSVGDVLVGQVAGSGTATLTNTASGTAGSADYTTSSTGLVSVSPSASANNGGTGATLGVGQSQSLTVTGAGAVGNVSGSGVQIGTISAANSNNPGAGDASPVNVTANIYDAAAVTPSASGQTFTNTGVGSNGANSLIAAAEIQQNNINPSNTLTQNFTSWSTTTPAPITAGNSGTVATINPTGLLNGTYHAVTSLKVGNVTNSGGAIAGATTGDVLNNSNYALTATVTGNKSSGVADTYEADILNSYAGYGIGSSAPGTTHTNTGGGGTTVGMIAYGTASNNTTLQMSFDTVPTNSDITRASDILTINGTGNGINIVGQSSGDGRFLTDLYVLTLSYDLADGGTAYILQDTSSGWINAVALNSNTKGGVFNPANDDATFVDDGGVSAKNESFTQYLLNNGGTPTLGDYGYANGVAWAVLDHTATGDQGLTEFAVVAQAVPEPSTYAMIFGGFGMLAAFRKARRKH